MGASLDGRVDAAATGLTRGRDPMPPFMRPVLRALGAVAALALSAFALLAVGPEVRYALAGNAWAWSVVALSVACWFAGLWGATWAAAGRNPLGRRRAEDIARPPRRYVGVRIALAYAALTSTYLLLGLPFPPTTASDRESAATLVVLVVAAIVGAVTVGREGPTGRVLILAGGAWGVLRLALVPWQYRGAMDDPGVGMVWSFVLAASIFVMWILAALVVLTTRRAWPSREADAGHAR